MKKSQPKATLRAHPLVGTWASADEFRSSVEYTVVARGDAFIVSAVDRDDGEKADIFETKWNGTVLTFVAIWNSTGQFVRCRMMAQSEEHVELTYTVTDKDLLHRKPARVSTPERERELHRLGRKSEKASQSPQ